MKVIELKITQQLKRKFSGTVLEVYGINSRNQTYFCKVISVTKSNPSKEAVGEKQHVSFTSIKNHFDYVN